MTLKQNIRVLEVSVHFILTNSILYLFNSNYLTKLCPILFSIYFLLFLSVPLFLHPLHTFHIEVQSIEHVASQFRYLVKLAKQMFNRDNERAQVYRSRFHWSMNHLSVASGHECSFLHGFRVECYRIFSRYQRINIIIASILIISFRFFFLFSFFSFHLVKVT